MNELYIADRIALNTVSLPESGVTKDNGFSERLKQAVSEVNNLQQVADDSIEQAEKGTLGIHDAMHALSEADISLRLFVQARNKVVEAYQEISRMQF